MTKTMEGLVADTLTPEEEARMRHLAKNVCGDWPDDLGVLLAEIDRLRHAMAGEASDVLLAMSDDAYVEAVGTLAAQRCIHCGTRTSHCHCMNDE